MSDVRRNAVLRALVFDMDGTLTDSDPLHREAFDRTLARHGKVIDHAFFRTRISGQPNEAITEALFPEWDVLERAQFAADKEALFRELAPTLQRLPGLDALLAWADRHGLKKALVTNAPRANALHMIEALALHGHYDALVLGEEVARPKPDPLPYLTALDLLGVSPAEAYAFEDSAPGVRAASGAGIVTFGVATSQPPEALRAAGAQHVIRDFDDPALWEVLIGATS